MNISVIKESQNRQQYCFISTKEHDSKYYADMFIESVNANADEQNKFIDEIITRKSSAKKAFKDELDKNSYKEGVFTIANESTLQKLQRELAAMNQTIHTAHLPYEIKAFTEKRIAEIKPEIERLKVIQKRDVDREELIKAFDFKWLSENLTSEEHERFRSGRQKKVTFTFLLCNQPVTNSPG